ncbi:MAG: proprotein convertase P-domain-containing protein [Pseudomonadota bacterium]
MKHMQWRKPGRATMIGTWVGVVALLAAGPGLAGPKEALHDELAVLDVQIAQLKREGSASGLTPALARCAEISVALGGDTTVATGTPAAAGVERGAMGGPPGCSTATTTAANTTALPLVDNGVSTSTLTVSGAGPFLWDLNATLAITHTFSGDLDITLRSPAGTVVTLSTDNGGANDNVFNGTTFDDDANPAGQVPYASNAGLVSDHPYANLTIATPLAPEEPLSAFAGENPNGVWTLTVSDDAIADTGSLGSWSLNMVTLGAAPSVATTPVSSSAAVPLVDAGVATATLAVAGAGTALCGVDLTAAITHTFGSDLDITLRSPAGTVVTLSTDNGGSNDNVFNGTLFDEDANPGGQVPYVNNSGVTTDHLYANAVLASPLTPEESFGAFYGENPNGIWTLTVSDDAAGDTGALANWSLALTTCACQQQGTLSSVPVPVDARWALLLLGAALLLAGLIGLRRRRAAA